MVELVGCCCQLQLFVHVPVRQAYTTVQVKESRFSFELEGHSWSSFRVRLLSGDGCRFMQTCRLMAEQLELNILIGSIKPKESGCAQSVFTFDLTCS